MTDERALAASRILIADDDEGIVMLLERLLEVSGFTDVHATTDPSRVIALCAELEPDVLLLDLHMPRVDGFELLGQLAPWINASVRLPVVVLTGDATGEAKRRALSLGAADFVNKPLDAAEAVLRIKNLLAMRLLQRELREQNRRLEESVRERTRELEEARVEALERLAFAAEYRDDAAGGHVARVGRLAALVASELDLPAETVELIGRAAPLHDVGNIGLPDAILLKRDRLTADEFEAMKLHVHIGGEILGGARSSLLQLAAEIALTHHERWDGSGYPAGLRGEQIPIAGRIVAAVDVLDTLMRPMAHKPAWDAERAFTEIGNQRGRHFDPRVVDVLSSLGVEGILGRGAPSEAAQAATAA